MQAASRSKCGHLHWNAAVNSLRRRPAAGCSILQQGVDALHAASMMPWIDMSIQGVVFGASFFVFSFSAQELYEYIQILLRFCLSHRVFWAERLLTSSSLNLGSMHCNSFRFSVDMPHVWNSFPVELRTNYNSLRAFRNNSMTFVYMYTAGTWRIS